MPVLVRGNTKEGNLQYGHRTTVVPEPPHGALSMLLSRFEQQHCRLTNIEVNEMSLFERHKTSEVLTDKAVPGESIFLIELSLDVRSLLLVRVEFVQGLTQALDGVLLHGVRHVDALHDRPGLSHPVAQTKRKLTNK